MNEFNDENVTKDISNDVISNASALNKKRKTKFIIGSFLIFIAIAIGLFIGYQKINSNPLAIYKKAINDTYKVFNKALSKDESDFKLDILNKPYVLDLNAKFDSNIPDLKAFSNINYNLSLGVDYQNEKGSLALNLSDDNTKIINIIASLINKNLYLKSDELLDKTLNFGSNYDIFGPIKTEFANLDLNTNLTKEDLDKFLKEFKDILIKSLDKKYFTMQSDTITLNNKEYKVKKVTYDLNAENLARTLKFIAKSLNDNPELIDTLSSISNTDKNEITSSLKEIIDNNDLEQELNSSDLKIVLYADTFNNIIKGLLEYDNEELITYENIKDEHKITLTDNTESVTLTLNEKTITLDIATQDLKGTLTLTDLNKKGSDFKEFKLDYNLSSEGTTLKGSISNNNLKITSNQISGDLNLDITINNSDEDISFTLISDYNLTQKDLTDIDTKNSIYYEDLSSKDLSKLEENLLNVLSKLNLEDILN